MAVIHAEKKIKRRRQINTKVANGKKNGKNKVYIIIITIDTVVLTSSLALVRSHLNRLVLHILFRRQEILPFNKTCLSVV